MSAEGGVPEQIQRLLQCAVCLDRFKQPKILPCQHTFCLSPCLEGLVEHRTRSVRCPECRADHFIPRSGVASFPNNLTIIGFLSLSENSTSDGNNRRGEQQLNRHCVNSNNSHRRSENNTNDGNNSNPNAMSSGAVGGNGSNSQAAAAAAEPMRDHINGHVDDGGCFVCHSQTTIQRCCHCENLVCDPCLQEHMNLVRAELGRLIGAVRRGLPHVTDQILLVRRKGVQLQSRCDGVKTEITEGVEKLIRELKARERALHEEVDSFLTGEMRGLRNYQENAEVEIASLNSFCDTAECLLGERRRIPTGDLIETKRQCEEHVETVQNYEDGSTPLPKVKQIQLSFESPFLSSTIGNLGELVITNRTVARLMMQQRSRDETTNVNNLSSSSRIVASDFERNGSDDDRGDPITQFGLILPPPPSSNSPSPSLTRRADRLLRQSAQVTFAENNDTNDNSSEILEVDAESRWDRLSHSIHRPQHRRSRHERLSDTTGMNPTSGSSLAQRLADRRRHQSLGALQIDEYDSSEEATATTLDGRRGGREDSSSRDRFSSRDLYSSSYPGTGSQMNDSDSHQYDSPSRQNFSLDFQNSPSTISSILNRNSSGRYVDTPRNRYNQKGNAIIQIGMRGSEPGQFIWPRGLAVSHLDDRIYVSDSSNHRVQIFNNTGHFIKSFGSYGQNDGEFDCLAGIAVTNLGQVVISDRYNHRIQIFDRNGNFQHCFGSEGSGNGELNYPWGVACDNMGFIYVCDKENHRVQVFQSNGTFVRVIGEHGSRIGQLENPHYVSVSQDNKVYVSDSSNHRVQVFSIYGDFLFGFGVPGSLRGQMKFPRGIAIDNQGFAIVADSGNNRIQVFRADGRFYSMFGNWGSENGQFKGLEGVAIQANGNIVISDRENHRVQIF